MLNSPFIWIDGIIGVGKTTAVEQIGKHLNLTVLTEPVNDELLKIYYEDQDRWGFPFQIDMLNKRFAIQLKASSDVNGSIIDRTLPGDRVFAKMLWERKKFHPLEWEIYEQSYSTFTNLLYPPNILIFLKTTPEVAYERIKNRAREAESKDLLPIEYLKHLRQEYRMMLEEFYLGKHCWSDRTEVLEIDWNKDWQSIDPIIEQIYSYFDLSEKNFQNRTYHNAKNVQKVNKHIEI